MRMPEPFIKEEVLDSLERVTLPSHGVPFERPMSLPADRRQFAGYIAASSRRYSAGRGPVLELLELSNGGYRLAATSLARSAVSSLR